MIKKKRIQFLFEAGLEKEVEKPESS